MSDTLRIGLVVPWATDTAPSEAAEMYPGVQFIARGVSVQALTPEGYESAWHAIVPAARQLASERVTAVMVIGTSLTNPLLKIADLAALAEIAHAAGAQLAVDNTFASPYLQQPIGLGADFVIHSTKIYRRA